MKFYFIKNTLKSLLKTVQNGLSSELSFFDFLMKSYLIFFSFCSSWNKLFKTGLTVQKVQILEDLCSLKVCLWKAKIWAFSSGNTQIFVFHKQTLRGHNSLKTWTFLACKNSFEKLISRTTRWEKDQVGFDWKNPIKTTLKTGHFSTVFINDFYVFLMK